LRVDFDDHARLVVRCDLDCDGTFGGNVTGFLGGLDGASRTHVVDCLFDVAARCRQRLLAIHHAQAGTLAQFLDQGRSNFCHVRIL